jgi:hypothetical protein
MLVPLRNDRNEGAGLAVYLRGQNGEQQCLQEYWLHLDSWGQWLLGPRRQPWLKAYTLDRAALGSIPAGRHTVSGTIEIAVTPMSAGGSAGAAQSRSSEMMGACVG